MTAQRSSMLFLLGVVLSTFVGGGVRVLLSPEVVSRWVEDVVKKKQPKFNFKFETAKLSLADGWRPHLAVELTGLSVAAKDKCTTESTLKIDRVIIPVLFRPLLEKKVQLGHVRGDLVELTVKPNLCTPQSSDWTTELESLESFFRRRWNKEVINTTKFITNLSIQNLRVRDGSTEEPKFHISNLQIEFLAQENVAKATFEFWPGVDWVGPQPFGPTQTALHIASDGLKWSAKSNLKEGQIHLKGGWKVEKSNVVFDTKWTDVPLAPLARLLARWQMINLHQIEPKNQWSSCHLNAQGSIRNWRDLSFVATNCTSTGDIGSIQIDNNEWALLRGKLTPFRAELKRVSLRKVAELFDIKAFKNVSSFGEFAGQFIFDEGRAWSLTGNVNGAELYVSLFEGNFKRPLGPLAVQADHKEGRVKVRMTGEDAFAMRLNFEMDFEKELGTPAMVKGRLYSKDNVLIETGSIYGFPFQNVDLKMTADFNGHQFSNVRGTANLADIELRPQHPFHPVLQQLGLALSAEEPVRLQKAAAAFDLESERLHVRGPIQTSIVGKELRFDTRVATGLFQDGEIELLDNGRTVRRLELEGSLQHPITSTN